MIQSNTSDQAPMQDLQFIQQALLQDPADLELWEALKRCKRPDLYQVSEIASSLSEDRSPASHQDSIKEFRITLDAIASYYEAGELKTVAALLDIATEFAKTADQYAWVDYYRALSSKSNHDHTDRSISLLISSCEKHPLSFACVELGLFYQHTSRARSYSYYLQALETEPELTPETSAFIQNWIDLFFDPAIYIRHNPDLDQLSEDQLLEHYIVHGIDEGRIGSVQDIEDRVSSLDRLLPENFDWVQYKHLNPDLDVLVPRSSTILEAELALKSHFHDYGKDEGRSYYILQIGSETDEETYSSQKSHFERIAYRQYSHFINAQHTLHIGASDTIQSKALPLISLVVVTYNKAHLTFQCLQAIANSSYQNIELILIDNASKDSSYELFDRVQGNLKIIRNTANLHFLKACNQAFELVSGDYIGLVNNDAILSSDAIENAYRCILRYNSRAIVGGKVLHLDGRIQDAGSIIFSDGSARGLGRRQLASDHRFNFERPVDYVAGCFLFTSTAILEDLNGFDPDYSPAYYEETDFCFRARRLGINSIYCPDCILHHYEFASSSQVSSDFASRQMRLNQKLFSSKHSDLIASCLSPIEFDESDITCLLHGHLSSLPRVLVIDDRVPVYSSGSGFSRAADLLDILIRVSSHVTLYATDFIRSKSQLTVCSRKGCEVIEDDPHKLKDFIHSRSTFYDAIIVSRRHNHHLLSSVLDDLRGNSRARFPRLIYDVESLFSIRQAAHEHLLETGSVFDASNSSALLSICTAEITDLSSADTILSVSELESSIIRSINEHQTILNLGHAFHDIKVPSISQYHQAGSIGMLGAIPEKSSPNYDALRWLNDELIHQISEVFDGSPPTLLIAGNITDPDAYSLAAEMADNFSFVEFLGPVDSLDQFFSMCRIFIAPTRYAAGIPHKVHMASSYAIPSVTTNLIATQLGWRAGFELIAADVPKDFAKAIYQLFNTQELWLDVASNLASRMQKECSMAKFEETIRKAVSLVSTTGS